MAGGDDKANKTLPPSEKRKREARKEGQIPRSVDLGAWGAMLGATVALPPLFHMVSHRVVGLFEAATASFAAPSTAEALRLLTQGMYVVLLGGGTAAVVFAGMAAALQVGQARPSIAWTKLKPKASNLSPVTGLKRMFSPNGLAEFLRALVKLALVAVVATLAIKSMMKVVSVGTVVPIGALLGLTGSRLLALMRNVAIAGVAVGAADWWWKRRQITQSLKMSHHEAKEEHRQEEGSPEARMGRRRAQMRLYRARMAGSVAGADVLVVNPTHYAVGLSYRSGSDSVPRVVARGVDSVALRLREDARRLGVPVVEDPPLARAVHGACVVGEVIPVELYEAVARLLAHVYSLRRAPALTRGAEGASARQLA